MVTLFLPTVFIGYCSNNFNPSCIQQSYSDDDDDRIDAYQSYDDADRIDAYPIKKHTYAKHLPITAIKANATLEK